jgi:hypothetical protein
MDDVGTHGGQKPQKAPLAEPPADGLLAGFGTESVDDPLWA